MQRCFPWFDGWSLSPKLLRRHLEEQIIALVPLEDSFIEESRSNSSKRLFP